MKLLIKIIPYIFFIIIIVAIQKALTKYEVTYYLTQLTMSAYYAVLIVGLSLLMGYAGQISLGHAGFFAIGGYCSAVLLTYNFMDFLNKKNSLIQFFYDKNFMQISADLYGGKILIFQPWPAFLIAVILAIIIAFLIGIPVLKLKGHYLAMATLGFGTIIYTVILAGSVFGGADGISEVPPLHIYKELYITGKSSLRVENYYIAFSVLLAGILLLNNLINSRVGRALRALHGSEDAVGASGINSSSYKVITFVISAVFAAAGGVLLTHYNGSIGPSESGIMKSVRYVSIVAVGGMSSIWGAAITAIILNYLSLRGLFGSYDDVIFGAILIIVMIFAPGGIFSLKFKKKSKIEPAQANE